MSDEAVSLRERVKAPPAQALVDAYFSHAVAAGKTHVFAHEMRVHLAHTLMLGDQRIIAPPDVAAILKALLALEAQGIAALAVDYTQEDLYSYVERHIVKALGPDTGGRMHTARSRNDLNVTSWRMALRERLLATLDALVALRRTTLALVDAHRETVMPGYTHTQHAQPISLGYYLLAFADLLARDHRRLAGALRSCDLCPLGAGALNTTGFPIDRHATTALLGFAGLMEVGYDCVTNRDDIHEAVAAAALLMTGLSRVATDLMAWNTMEYGFIELADQFSSVSSIMPQKKNPQALEFTRAAAASVAGALTTVLAASKNTAFGDVNDGVTSPNVPALEALEKTRHGLVVMEGVLATMTVRPEVMRHAAAIGFGTATELADVIVRETGLSFRKAHNIVGRVVRETIVAGKPATAITAADLAAASTALFGSAISIPTEAVRVALDPDANIRSRTVAGGPAPEAVARMAADRGADLARDATTITTTRQRIGDAEVRLREMAARRAAG